MFRRTRPLAALTASLCFVLVPACGGDTPEEGAGDAGEGSGGRTSRAGNGGTQADAGPTPGGSSSNGGRASNGGKGGDTNNGALDGGSTDGGAGSGKSGSSTGGAETDGGSPIGGDGGTGGNGNTPAVTDLGDIISAACDYEFRCCDVGERAYRLSPFAETSDDCADRIGFQLTSNNTDNPYVAGPFVLGSVLGSLAYRVNFSRVEVDADGADACVAQWEDLGCAKAADADARCEGPAEGDACALTNIFIPILKEGDECTPELSQSTAQNDVECIEGTTCADVGDPDNPNDVPTCVQRGLEGDPCANDDDCDFNFYCFSGDCTEKGGSGDPCSFNDPDSPAPGDEDAQCKVGLSCHPVDFECIESCSLGFTCATTSGDNDPGCPDDTGCTPIEVDEGTAAFRVCTQLGSSAAALCNSDADCNANRYCDNTNCQADLELSDPCTAQNQCAVGLHCDLVNTGLCATNLAPTAACVEDYQCGPSSAGCLDSGSLGLVCRNSLLADEETCGADAACASTLCEFATDAAVESTCVPGTSESDPCDNLVADGDAQRCAPGYLCFGPDVDVTAASGECIEKSQPGRSCKDPDGDPNAALCANASTCEDQWDEGETCTDAPVSKVNGGTDLTCDGK